jgi:hypothetical protein
MKTVVNETDVEGNGDFTCAFLAPRPLQGTKRVAKAVKDLRVAAVRKLKEGKRSAGWILKDSRSFLEEGIGNAAHKLKTHPFRLLAIAFAAGAIAGFLSPRIAQKSR